MNQSTPVCLVENARQLVTMTTPAHARTDEAVLTVNVSIQIKVYANTDLLG